MTTTTAFAAVCSFDAGMAQRHDPPDLHDKMTIEMKLLAVVVAADYGFVASSSGHLGKQLLYPQSAL